MSGTPPLNSSRPNSLPVQRRSENDLKKLASQTSNSNMSKKDQKLEALYEDLHAQGLIKKTSGTEAGQAGYRSPLKEVSPKMNKSRNDKFHRRFKNIPDDEVVIKCYSCAFFGDILLQGYMYISPNWFCFYSKILGHEKQLEIPVTKVLNITREKTAFIIPNAIGLVTAKDKYVFGSLMSRDSTFRLMWTVWKQSQNQDVGDKDVDELDFDESIEVDSTISGHDNNNIYKKGSSDFSHMGGDDDDDESESESDLSVCMLCGLPAIEHDGQSCDGGGVTPSSLKSTPSSVSTQGMLHSNQQHSRPKAFQGRGHMALSCQRQGKSSHAVSLISKVQSLPKTNLLIAICTILVMFLALSAVIMLYKILTLQAQLDLFSGPTDPEGGRILHSYKLYSDMYYLNNQYHTASIQKLHTVLQANIQVLDQVHQSLKSLEDSPLLTKKKKVPTATLR